MMLLRIQQIPLLRSRRKARQHMIHIRLEARYGCSSIHTSGDQCRIQPKLFLGHPADILIQILRRIRERSEDKNFLIARIDRLPDLIPNNIQKLIQLKVIFRSNIFHHQDQQLQVFQIFIDISLPRDIIHIPKVDLYLLSHTEEICVQIVVVEILLSPGQVCHLIKTDILSCNECIYDFCGSIDVIIYTPDREQEGMDRALHSL